ncbi:hypothetical protein ACWF94_16760 [Streptomyces sp. NPDC055078]
MPNKEVRHSRECMSDAEVAVRELVIALDQTGIVLPSVRVEADSYARERPCPLIELGRVTVDVVRRLAAALRREENGGPR